MALILLIISLAVAGIFYLMSRRGSVDGVELAQLLVILVMVGVTGYFLIDQVKERPEKDSANTIKMDTKQHQGKIAVISLQK